MMELHRSSSRDSSERGVAAVWAPEPGLPPLLRLVAVALATRKMRKVRLESGEWYQAKDLGTIVKLWSFVLFFIFYFFKVSGKPLLLLRAKGGGRRMDVPYGFTPLELILSEILARKSVLLSVDKTIGLDKLTWRGCGAEVSLTSKLWSL